MAKIKLIVTSGPTREFVDPIRFLSNPSSGKMGYYIAKAGINHGLKVTYISGPISAKYSEVEGAKNISVISTRDMLKAVSLEIKKNSALIMAAAPADYRPAQQFKRKLKKSDAPSIELILNPDILKTISRKSKKEKLQNFFLVGFAAETHNIEAYALKKLNEKNLDLIFLNDVIAEKAGFGTDTNELKIFFRGGRSETWAPDSKERLGYRIVDSVLGYIKNYA